MFIVRATNEKGETVSTLTSQQFMEVAKERFGIGSNRFLIEYVEHYNRVMAPEKMTATIELESKYAK